MRLSTAMMSPRGTGHVAGGLLAEMQHVAQHLPLDRG
jgi:hypothetical protein